MFESLNSIIPHISNIEVEIVIDIHSCWPTELCWCRSTISGSFFSAERPALSREDQHSMLLGCWTIQTTISVDKQCPTTFIDVKRWLNRKRTFSGSVNTIDRVNVIDIDLSTGMNKDIQWGYGIIRSDWSEIDFWRRVNINCIFLRISDVDSNTRIDGKVTHDWINGDHSGAIWIPSGMKT